MTEVTLHQTPRGRDVVLEQVRIVGLRLRREALVAAVVLAILTVVIAVDIIRGSADTWFDSDEWVGFGFISFFLPFAVWRQEKRFEPAFLWTLPVDRRRLALAKVFGGWVWLMAALAFFIVWQIALAAFSGVAGAETVSPYAFTGTTATYLFGSALVLGLRHPLRWVLGTGALFFLLGTLDEAVGPTASGARMFASSALRSLFYGIDTLLNSVQTGWQTLPVFAQSTLPTLLSLGAGLAALWAAASRHGERRRH